MEWLTDKEKRILFSALAREKKVCVKEDNQREPREPYEHSLKYVCDSLEHKFYYDRLFNKMEKKIREMAIDDCIKIIKFHRDNYDGIEWAIRDIEELKSKL